MPEIHSYHLNLHHHSYQEQFCFPKKHMVQAGCRAWMKLRGGKPLDRSGKSITSLGNLLLWNVLWVWEFPGERCFQFWKGLRVVRHLKGKWKWPETTETTPKQARTGWWNRRASVLVRHSALWPRRSTSASLTCIMYWRKLVWSTTSARRCLILLPLKSRGSKHGWGKWAWDSVRAAPESNPPIVPQALPIDTFWALLYAEVYRGGSQAETEAQLKRRITRCLRDMDWEPLRSRMKGLKTGIRKVADKSPQIFL